MTVYINKIRIDSAAGDDSGARCRIVLQPTASENDIQRDIEVSFTLESNGLEILGYDALERAAEQLEKRPPESSGRVRAAKIRAFLQDIQST